MAGALLLCASVAFAQEAERPGFFDRVKQRVKENITVNGKPLADPTSRPGEPMRGTMDANRSKLWLQPQYTPETLEGAMHLRVGASGIDNLSSVARGKFTCDLFYVFAAKANVPISDASLDSCAWQEYQLARDQGTLIEEVRTGNPEGKARATALYRPFVEDRIRRFRNQETFWFRPDRQHYDYTQYSADRGVYELQFKTPTWGGQGGDDQSNGNGFVGEGWTYQPFDPSTKRRTNYPNPREDSAKWLVTIPVSVGDREWFERGGPGGPDQRLFFKVNRAYTFPLQNGRRLNLMDIDIYKVQLDMRVGTVNNSPSRQFIIE